MQRITRVLGVVAVAVATASVPRVVAADASTAAVARWPGVAVDRGDAFIDLWTEATTTVALFAEAVRGTDARVTWC